MGVCGSVLQCVAVCCSVLQRVAMCFSVIHTPGGVWQCVATVFNGDAVR